MFHRRANRGLRAAFFAAAVGLAFAQPFGSTPAQAAVTPQQVTDFKANPSSALPRTPGAAQQNPSAAQLAQLTAFIRDLLLADPTTLNTIISLLTTANPAEQAAIGRGLAQAALAVVQTNRDLANQIQQAIAASGIQVAINAYAESAGNVVTAATGGGGTGGGGGGATGGGAPSGGGGGGSTGGTGGGTSSGGGSGLTTAGGSFSSSNGGGTTSGATTSSTQF
jgi:hypothetical protein